MEDIAQLVDSVAPENGIEFVNPWRYGHLITCADCWCLWEPNYVIAVGRHRRLILLGEQLGA